MKVIYPGSFDPITNGHLDIIERSCSVFDEVIVATLINPSKNPMFTPDERVKLIREATSHLKNVTVVSFSGLLVDYMKEENIKGIVKGLRAVSDYEYELQMAYVNKDLYPECETFFMPTSTKYSYLSSSIVKQISSHNEQYGHLVPTCVYAAMQNRKA